MRDMTIVSAVRTDDPKTNVAYSARWIVDCIGAHPLWWQYALFLVDLTTPLEKPPIIHKAGVTHEFLLFALDPDKVVREPGDPISLLQPANQGYQFTAESDQAAYDRINNYAERIERRELNPDTDNRRWWDYEFREAFALVHSVFTIGDIAARAG